MWPGGRKSARERPSSPGYLCLYAGKQGVAKAVAHRGLWALTFDWTDGSSQDLLDPALQSKIAAAICTGAFVGVGMSPPCETFSVAVRPPVRSTERSEGVLELRKLGS